MSEGATPTWKECLGEKVTDPVQKAKNRRVEIDLGDRTGRPTNPSFIQHGVPEVKWATLVLDTNIPVWKLETH